MTTNDAAPAPDADALVERLRDRASIYPPTRFDLLDAADALERLTSERDEARAQRNEYDAAHKREAAATLRQMAECERLRAALVELIESHDAYKRAPPPLDGPRPLEWDRWQQAWAAARAAVAAARGEGK